MVNKDKLYESKKFNNIKEVIDNAVNLYPDNNAFILKNKIGKKVEYKNITYKMLQEDINSLGTKFINMGLKGKRVAVIAPNRYEWVVTYLAVVNGIGLIVPLDKGLPDDEIESLLNRSYSDVVVFDKKYKDIMEKIRDNNNSTVKKFICMDNIEEFTKYEDLIQDGKKLLEDGEKEYLEAEINNDEMSIILFTSGTTSLSKAVMLSHRNIAENIYALNAVESVNDKDVSLAFLPFHHTFACTGFLFFLSNGATAVFCDGLRYIADNIKEYGVSVFVCVPLLLETMYKKINFQIEKQGKAKVVKFGKILCNFLLKFGIDIRRKVFKSIIDQLGGKLRFVVSGAAGIDKEVAKGFNDFGIKTVQGYGLTETSPVLTAENDKYLRYGSVGVPLINVEVDIDNPNENGIGEVKAKGPNIMLGYYENEEATNEVLKDGWFYTGDLGYFDKDGYLFITGRKKNVIVLKNGKNIYPEELEMLVSNLPYVSENMIFGYPKDDDLIISIKIVLNKEYIKEHYSEYNEQELNTKIWNDIKEINKNMPNYKHIKKMFLSYEPMIKTTTQKIKRFQEIEKIVKEG